MLLPRVGNNIFSQLVDGIERAAQQDWRRRVVLRGLPPFPDSERMTSQVAVSATIYDNTY
jgi:hypothetical protein